MIRSQVLSGCLTYQVAEEISGPLTSAKKITLVSSGSGAVGAAKVTGEVLDILSRLPESVERLTGVSISQVRAPRGVEQSLCTPEAHDSAHLDMYSVLPLCQTVLSFDISSFYNKNVVIKLPLGYVVFHKVKKLSANMLSSLAHVVQLKMLTSNPGQLSSARN